MPMLNFPLIDSQCEDNISFVTSIKFFLVLMNNHINIIMNNEYSYHVTFVGIPDQLLIPHSFYYPLCI